MSDIFFVIFIVILIKQLTIYWLYAVNRYFYVWKTWESIDPLELECFTEALLLCFYEYLQVLSYEVSLRRETKVPL